MSKLLLVGSVAAKRWFKDFREPQDIDYLGDDIIVDGKVWTIKDRPNYKWLINKYDIATPSLLYTLKVTHSFWDIHFDKTLADIRFFQRKNIEFDYEIYHRLHKDNEKVHGKKQVYLNKDNEQFFQDGVNRIYVHDDIHRVIAFYDRPLYEKCKQDVAKATVSKELFYQLSYDDQIKMALEEIYVTALERFIIPNIVNSPKIVLYMAFKQLVVSMTKGWFPLFLMLHANKIINSFSREYVVKFQNNISKIRRINDVIK